MGYPMVQNLATKLPQSTHIYVFDVATQVMENLVTEYRGEITACQSSKEVTSKCDVILTMVPEGAHVKSVFLAPDTGVLAADMSGKIFIEMSTIDTATLEDVRGKIAAVSPSALLYDAPVSGGSLGAQNATLIFMVGCSGEDPNWSLLTSLLGLVGKSFFPCGGLLLGLIAKLSNNYCSGLIAIATAEAMNIGMKSGMNPALLASIFATIPAVCPTAPTSNGYRGGFKVQLMRKDFALAVDAAKRVDARLALGEAGLQIYTDASNDPACRDLDSRVVFRYLGRLEKWKEGSS
ncbi:hypothetical protein DL98DRAFT_552782 [Cadophora sp. DSE1049]|nr:hypothetical protein DL98DRAFT_552782 [Cadophora sp. DSE1049]